MCFFAVNFCRCLRFVLCRKKLFFVDVKPKTELLPQTQRAGTKVGSRAEKTVSLVKFHLHKCVEAFCVGGLSRQPRGLADKSSGRQRSKTRSHAIYWRKCFRPFQKFTNASVLTGCERMKNEREKEREREREDWTLRKIFSQKLFFAIFSLPNLNFLAIPFPLLRVAPG